MESIGFTETLLADYQSTLRNIREEGRYNIIRISFLMINVRIRLKLQIMLKLFVPIFNATDKK
jgi:hypothetical protein